MSTARELTIDPVVSSDLWNAVPSADATVQRAISSAATLVEGKFPSNAELAVVFTDDAHIRELNREWRKRDAPTNVLSFPASPSPAAGQCHLGDVILAFETLRREAETASKPFDHHLAHLAVHGFLHLLGYDHEDDDSATAMEGLETRALAALGIPDPYAG
jgi:probable rRNA maturation factor